jgi:two-component system sensor histidine kinase CpxA
MIRTMYARVFLAFWATAILIVIGTVALTWFIVSDRAEQTLPRSTPLVQTATKTLLEGGEPALVAWLESDAASSGETEILVLDEHGRELLNRPVPRTVARLLGDPYGSLKGTPGVEVVPARPVPMLVLHDGRRYSIFAAPHRILGLWPALPREDWLGILALALLITGAASWWLSRSITDPVRALGSTTRELTAGDLNARVDAWVTGRRDELGSLGRDFDAMAGRLQELLRGREQLLRDLSHELRSPLARMRVALGLAMQSERDAQQEFGRLETEVERLDKMIGQMLQLSRVDAADRTMFLESVDLVDLLDGIARDADFEARARNVRVIWRAPGGEVRIQGHAAWLASAIENVVRNAVRYTADGTAVLLELHATAARAEISVRDHGPGVPDAERGRIFQPFHRVAESRTRDTGGDGIGLAITARVVAAHGGEVVAENAVPGLRVTLSLPLVQRAEVSAV